MKKIGRKTTVLVILFIASLLPGMASAQITCDVDSSCSGDEVGVIGMSAEYNAHAALASEDEYSPQPRRFQYGSEDYHNLPDLSPAHRHPATIL